MIDKGILIYLFAFHRIPILLIIAQPQSLRYEQTAYTHNKAPFSTGMVRITVYWQDFAHTHFSQFSKNMLEFCILLLIPSMYVLILKSVFYQGRPILRKMPQCVFRASTYSTAQGHGTYILHKVQLGIISCESINSPGVVQWATYTTAHSTPAYQVEKRWFPFSSKETKP